MRYFYDTEFIENGKTIDLISIGIVAEDGREYYAVNSDMPMDRIREHDWLLRNVIPALPITGRRRLDEYVKNSPNHHPRPSVSIVEPDLKDSRVKPRWVIRNEVRDFLLHDNDEGEGGIQPELWAYYGAYDHVALAQLFGTMISLPKGVPMWTNDLRQEQHRLGISERSLPPQGGAMHNAIEDARWNREVHEFLMQATL